MSYIFIPFITLLLNLLILPFSTKHKKFFFKKSFFLTKPINVNAAIFINYASVLLLCFFNVYFFLTPFWLDQCYSNIFLVFFHTISCMYIYLFLRHLSTSLLSWEVIFITVCLICTIVFFFFKCNFFTYFFLLEIVGNLVFFLVFLNTQKQRNGLIYNQTLQFNHLYMQLLVNSLVSLVFIGYLIYINLQFSATNSFLDYHFILLIVCIKVGFGPTFTFKWYIYKNINYYNSFLLTVIYLLIFFFFIIYIQRHFSQLLVAPWTLFMFILLINFLILIIFFQKIIHINHFLQYSSALTYNLFFLFLI